MKNLKKYAISLFVTILILSFGCNSNNDSTNSYNNKNNSAPTANAGNNRTATVNSNVILDGSLSSDPDNDTLSYKWELSKPSNSMSVLSSANKVNPSFIPDIEGIYTVTLTVNDGKTDSTSDSVDITVIAESANTPPVANAGDDQTVEIGTEVSLNGNGSFDADNDPLTYMWELTKPQGSNSKLSDNKIVNPTLTPDVEGNYTISLIVNDGTVDSNEDTVLITVNKTDISFSSDVQPIFNNNCIGCHSSGGSASFLNLTSGSSYSELVNKSATKSSGTRVVPSDSGSSVLYKRISGTSAGAQMPYGGSPLSIENQNITKNWIDQGAKNN